MRKSFTLVELSVVVVMVGAVILALTVSSIFFIRRIAAKKELYDIHTQINRALEDMRLRSISAIDIPDRFTANSSRGNFTFRGEADIYKIEPNDDSDYDFTTGTGTKLWYTYRALPGDVTQGGIDIPQGTLVLEAGSTNPPSDNVKEVLIGARYSPQVNFEWPDGSQPHILRVTISATGPKSGTVSQTTALRFWFLDVAMPN